MTVRNNASFATNDLLLIGNPREERTEIEQCVSLTGVTVINSNAALDFTHSKGTPIYRILWNFVSLERRTSSAGSFTEITQSGLQYDNPRGLTIYFDSAATDAYEYRFRYYNSVTGTYSEYSPTISGAAPDRKTVRYMMQQVRKLINDQERKLITDEEMIRGFNHAQDIIYTHNPKYWFLYVDTFELGSGSIAATAGNDKYTLNNLTNFGHLSSIKYRYNSGSDDVIYHLRKKSEAEFDYLDRDQNTTDDNWPEVFKLIPADASSDNGYFKVTPDIKDSGIGTFYPTYYEKMADLDTVDDKTQVPLPDLLIDYCTGYCYRLIGNEKKVGQYLSRIENPTSNPDLVPPGIGMLDKMNENQKAVVGQPMYLKKFLGHRATRRLFGNKFPQSDDYIKENYF